MGFGRTDRLGPQLSRQYQGPYSNRLSATVRTRSESGRIPVGLAQVACLAELHVTARNKLKSAQHRPNIIAACWQQAEMFANEYVSYIEDPWAAGWPTDGTVQWHLAGSGVYIAPVPIPGGLAVRFRCAGSGGVRAPQKGCLSQAS